MYLIPDLPYPSSKKCGHIYQFISVFVFLLFQALVPPSYAIKSALLVHDRSPQNTYKITVTNNTGNIRAVTKVKPSFKIVWATFHPKQQAASDGRIVFEYIDKQNRSNKGTRSYIFESIFDLKLTPIDEHGSYVQSEADQTSDQESFPGTSTNSSLNRCLLVDNCPKPSEKQFPDLVWLLHHASKEPGMENQSSDDSADTNFSHLIETPVLLPILGIDYECKVVSIKTHEHLTLKSGEEFSSDSNVYQIYEVRLKTAIPNGTEVFSFPLVLVISSDQNIKGYPLIRLFSKQDLNSSRKQQKHSVSVKNAHKSGKVYYSWARLLSFQALHEDRKVSFTSTAPKLSISDEAFPENDRSTQPQECLEPENPFLVAESDLSQTEDQPTASSSGNSQTISALVQNIPEQNKSDLPLAGSPPATINITGSHSANTKVEAKLLGQQLGQMEVSDPHPDKTHTKKAVTNYKKFKVNENDLTAWYKREITEKHQQRRTAGYAYIKSLSLPWVRESVISSSHFNTGEIDTLFPELKSEETINVESLSQKTRSIISEFQTLVNADKTTYYKGGRAVVCYREKTFTPLQPALDNLEIEIAYDSTHAPGMWDCPTFIDTLRKFAFERSTDNHSFLILLIRHNLYIITKPPAVTTRTTEASYAITLINGQPDSQTTTYLMSEEDLEYSFKRVSHVLQYAGCETRRNDASL